jgi:hypothetical protein
MKKSASLPQKKEQINIGLLAEYQAPNIKIYYTGGLFLQKTTSA